MFVERRSHIKAIYSRHHQVEDNHVRLLAPGRVDRLAATVCTQHLTSQIWQAERDQFYSLWVDRFNLQFHRETRQGPVYLLALGTRAPKLTEVKDKGEFEWVGSLQGAAINGDGLAGKNISMPVLAQRLSWYLKKPVFDQTGLKGFFDFRFEYATDEAQPDVTSCIVTSLQGIGLKLKPSQGPSAAIVIDHAEKPSAN
jgi:uncharacterized protein (TIGR03435 family)